MTGISEKGVVFVVLLLFFTTAQVTGNDSNSDESDDSDSDSVNECNAPPVSVACDEPKTQMMSSGIVGSAPLFSDAKMKTVCKKHTENVLKSKTRSKPAKPFGKMFTCEDNEVMTGFEICYQMDLVYIAPYCTELEDGYKLDLDNIQYTQNSPEQPEKAMCPDDMAQITMELKKVEETGEISVSASCAKVVKQ